MAKTPATLPEALTFDDVLLRPGHSRVMPSHVDVSSRLTRGLPSTCQLYHPQWIQLLKRAWP